MPPAPSSAAAQAALDDGLTACTLMTSLQAGVSREWASMGIANDSAALCFSWPPSGHATMLSCRDTGHTWTCHESVRGSEAYLSKVTSILQDAGVVQGMPVDAQQQHARERDRESQSHKLQQACHKDDLEALGIMVPARVKHVSLS